VNENLRRRQAAFLLRSRAADDLDEASRLDGYPAMRLLVDDLKAIAAKAGCDPERLADAALALYPGTADTAEGQE
jgi:hypothetical protein